VAHPWPCGTRPPPGTPLGRRGRCLQENTHQQRRHMSSGGISPLRFMLR
jgi:hypothetical protein